MNINFFLPLMFLRPMSQCNEQGRDQTNKGIPNQEMRHFKSTVIFIKIQQREIPRKQGNSVTMVTLLSW